MEGLEIFTDSIQSLSEQVAAIGQPQTTAVTGTVLGTSTETPLVNLGAVKIKAATVALDMKVEGELLANGGLTVDGPAEFKGTTIFHKLVTFVEKTVFNNDVAFEGRATFNSDAGGFATIATGEKTVQVNFDRPYEQLPVVTVNVRDGQFVDYAYKDLTSNGFTIVLKDPAEQNVQFAWTAMSVQNPSTQ